MIPQIKLNLKKYIIFIFISIVSNMTFAQSTCTDYFGDVPVSFSLNEYIVYRGDFDQDNVAQDFLLFGRETFILIHGDISIPILLKGATSIKLIRQSNGSYARVAAERVCNGSHLIEYEKSYIADLLQSGAISEVSPNNVISAQFNTDNREDFLLREGGQTLIFHWSDTGPTQVSSLSIPSNYSIAVSDVNGDGRADIEVFDGSQFINVFVANDQGYFADPDSEDDAQSKHVTIERTWQRFRGAVSNGNHTASLVYLTPKFADDFMNIVDVIGAEAGGVVDQIESIAPYYSDNNISVYLARKRGDDGEYYIHTITFKRSDDNSWKIEEM